MSMEGWGMRERWHSAVGKECRRGRGITMFLSHDLRA